MSEDFASFQGLIFRETVVPKKQYQISKDTHSTCYLIAKERVHGGFDAMKDVVEEFLSNFPETIRKITDELRKIVRDNMPKAHEFLYYDAVNYSVNDSPIGRICYLSPSQDHVMVGFLFGTHLEDQHHLLQGAGKQARHVKVKTMDEAKNRYLKELVKAAWSHGPEIAAK